MNLTKQQIQSQYSEIKGNFLCQQWNIRNRNQDKSPIWYSNKKNKIPRNKPNQGGKRAVLRKLDNSEERNEGRYKQIFIVISYNPLYLYYQL